MKIDNFDKNALIANLRVFRDIDMSVSHPELRTYLEQGYSLLGGGFYVVDQPVEGGNMATADFPDSTISWRGRSQDYWITSPSQLEVFAIGIQSTLFIPDSTVVGPDYRKSWDVITSYSSMEFLNGPPSSPVSFDPVSVAKPLPGFALCGGGGVVHPGSVGGYLISLEPTRLSSGLTVRILEPHKQTFTVRSSSDDEKYTVTAYAMGIKIQPSLIPPPPLTL